MIANVVFFAVPQSGKPILIYAKIELFWLKVSQYDGLNIGLIILLPLVMHIVGGSRAKKILQGIFHVCTLISVVAVGFFMLRLFGIYFVICIPVLMQFFAIVKKLRRNP